ncbi:MAG TPA: DUF1127 domain-containing protein [Bosea sp. (in: a-proteobacteria)]|jgi:uncharacterized protein YjiS (DUF1127 family)|uniref:DUF1127 domain-containing protein n=1 Tax=Bosea sp. (in: a-proteobacteria) TaxID=1871050 RepID=UPI002E1012BA|nr:DUF1127 domain-containing protein [Bosea sp. (in: a-proteobacteria)]
MYAFRQESFTGCTGPGRQMCEVRPASRTLFPTLPTTAAPAPAQPGGQPRIEASRPSGADDAGSGRSWLARINVAIAGFRERAAERRRNRQIDLELSRLDNRTLRDIGLSRTEIEAAASEQRGGR